MKKNYFAKSSALLLIIVVAPIIAGLYGAIHDQLTYTISPEYYTKFKFYQFEFAQSGNEAILPNPRLYVGAVGFMASWWMGLPIGVIFGLVSLTLHSGKGMLQAAFKAFFTAIVVAFCTGLIGLMAGKFFLLGTEGNWYLPVNLVDRASFIAVGSMHNFSYIGGITGLIAGVIVIIRRRRLGVSIEY